MNIELFREWMNALRSDQYKQTRRFLHTQEGYCCLGVAMEVSDPTMLWKETPYYGYYTPPHEDPRYLHDRLEHALGLDMMMECSIITAHHVTTGHIRLGNYLSGLNDGGFSFKFIANVAESFLSKKLSV